MAAGFLTLPHIPAKINSIMQNRKMVAPSRRRHACSHMIIFYGDQLLKSEEKMKNLNERFENEDCCFQL